MLNLLPPQFEVRRETSLTLPPPPVNMPTRAGASLTIPGNPDHKRHISFSQDDLNRFHQHHAWLSDDCINGGSQVILRHLGTARSCGNPALFSTWIHTNHLHGDDDSLWRFCRDTPEFWTKDIWLLPIHKNQNHWVLAIVYWKETCIAYFDSLSDLSTFESDVKV